MKLNAREIPLVTFHRTLPEFLGPGDGCFIEIEARAGGVVNPAYMRGVEQLLIKARIMDRQREKITDDAEFVKRSHADNIAVARDRFGVVYDACVISWRSNIVDGGEPISCDRERFMGLADARVPELAEAFAAFEKAVTEAGKLVREAEDAALKN